ncbi:MAG: ABC transporter ATP-binding protein [Rhodospirillaceae bacterium]|nr:ABC transporter ATP-binding protein [Rhodospirillaceae bacterium]
MLEVADLKASYGRNAVLQGISFSVGEGETVCLIGSNGAGKTTTMISIAGLLRPVSGAISLAGTGIAREPAQRIVARGLALVPEGRRVFAPLSVFENLEIGAYRRRDSAAIRQDLDFVYGVFPRLKERHSQAAGTLSGGEQQMLAIGRALMSRPRVLLLDEPSMGLAPLVVAEIFRVIGELNRKGLTILLAEQNVTMALGVAKRGYVIESGRIVLSGSAEELANDSSVQAAYLGV